MTYDRCYVIFIDNTHLASLIEHVELIHVSQLRIFGYKLITLSTKFTNKSKYSKVPRILPVHTCIHVHASTANTYAQHTGIEKADILISPDNTSTVNSLMFARDLFCEFRDHL